MKTIKMITTSLATYFLFSSSALAITLECESVEGKAGKVTIESEHIANESVYSHFAKVQFSEMKDDDLNTEVVDSIYIRDEGNDELPVVLTKLSEHQDETDALGVIFLDDDLNTAELIYQNMESEIQIVLSKVTCTKQ